MSRNLFVQDIDQKEQKEDIKNNLTSNSKNFPTSKYENDTCTYIFL